MAAIEKVTPTEILAAEGATKPVVPDNFLQLVGVQLAVGVGGLMALVTLVLVAYWILTVPSLSPIAGVNDVDKVRQFVEIQKQVRDAHLEAVVPF